MPRYSKTQKQVQDTVQSTPRRPRKKREVKKPPEPFFLGAKVMITSPNDFKGIKLGLIKNVCKDGGINVMLTNPTRKGVAEDFCVHVERGHTIGLLDERPI